MSSRIPTLLRSGTDALRRALGSGGAVLPATAAVVAACAVVAAAQFLDYRAIDIATGDYSSVEGVAPAPRISSDLTGSAHGFIPLGLAAVALSLVVAGHRGRWQLVRLIAPLGLAVLAISLLIDLPAARDIADAERDYNGAESVLLSGFWLQLAGGAAMIAASLALAGALRSRRDATLRHPRGVNGGPAGEGAAA